VQYARPIGHLFDYDNKRAEPLARWLLKVADHPMETVADVGCGTRPLQPWLRKLKPEGQLDYFGVDVDPAAVAKLNEMGLECVGPDEAAQRQAQVVFAYEVVEHIPPAEDDDFWSFLQGLTQDVLVLTTPNFEGFRNGIYPEPDRTEMRYVPDHFKDWSPTSTDPHAHKIAYTAQSLSDRIASHFPGPTWDHLVYRAWRWTLVDHGAGTVHEHYFKLHAVAWRRELFDRASR